MTLSYVSFPLQSMVRPDPRDRPSASSLVQSTVLCPFEDKSRDQLRQELNHEKFKNEILQRYEFDIDFFYADVLFGFAMNPVMIQLEVIKSPQYTGGDFMFLYRFVRRQLRRRPQILVHAITFEQLFGFLSFLAQLLALTCRLPD